MLAESEDGRTLATPDSLHKGDEQNSTLTPATHRNRCPALGTGRQRRLEPDAGKLARPVLRGGDDGDVVPLPD
jgi:hypothetical protein